MKEGLRLLYVEDDSRKLYFELLRDFLNEANLPVVLESGYSSKLIYKGEEVIGMVYEGYYISELYIVPKHRNKKYATRIITHIIDRGIDRAINIRSKINSEYMNRILRNIGALPMVFDGDVFSSTYIRKRFRTIKIAMRTNDTFRVCKNEYSHILPEVKAGTILSKPELKKLADECIEKHIQFETIYEADYFDKGDE